MLTKNYRVITALESIIWQVMEFQQLIWLNANIHLQCININRKDYNLALKT